ncbi:M48 family metalloprotease [Ovoidimarina sediminis]|uniref:M48 family metalloprotease n=1 Tax=Ovoidimarina sediminis TaxID=3079856 RepID=UPI00290E1D28|nr:M48 family metalloprotease [Rhodophyticola sp. MJ-SS7]MDU8945055.1 M48 family metalloprotease [Rhodophyticola sp. MJ-SS7]
MRALRIGCLAALLALVAFAASARTLLRDPDIEYALKKLAEPIVGVSGMSIGRIDIMVIHDDRMNAFIVDDRTVFIHSGLILRLGSAAELQSVIAHEIAHIANGHIPRRLSNRRAASRSAFAGMALGLAAALAGESQAAAGLAIGTQSSAMAAFFAHTRAEEAAADASGLRFMAEVGIDPRAAIGVLERFRGQEALAAPRRDPYVQTHPLTRDRMRAVEGMAAGLRVIPADRSSDEYWFRRAQGKLGAFVRSPRETLRKVKSSDGSDIAVMRRAIAYHRQANTQKARAEIDRLAAMRPTDPFVHELRGQILMESRAIGPAVQAYGRAVELRPSDPLILASYGRALLAAERYGTALDVLTRARARDARNPVLLRDLAVAYARNGQNGMASVSTAERYAMIGQAEDAVIHAKRAAGLLPAGSPGRRRAEDILAAFGGSQ